MPKRQAGRFDVEHEAARWYLSYVNMDVLECLEWQLAEPRCPLDANPCIPLVGVYEAGFLPFALSQREMVLFAFDRAKS